MLVAPGLAVLILTARAVVLSAMSGALSGNRILRFRHQSPCHHGCSSAHYSIYTCT